jgi:hypothetical protein
MSTNEQKFANIEITSLQQYAKAARETLAVKETTFMNLAHMFNGLDSEVGEMKDALKRCIFYKKDIQDISLKHFDKVKFFEEVGDAFWFIAVALECASGTTLEQVVELAMDSPDIEAGIVDDRAFYREVIKLGRITSKIDEDHFDFGIPTPTTWAELTTVVLHLIRLCDYMSLPLLDVLSANINKLRLKRYKKGVFTELEATEENRDRSGEALIMDSALS